MTERWTDANQRHLGTALADVRRALERHVAGAGRPVARRDDAATWTADERPALDALCAAFGLTRFERAVLLLCAGAELDAGFLPLCAAAHGDPQRAYPTFGLALAALPEAHWSALTPAAPLRRWRLIEVSAGGPLTQSALRVDERILHYLAGVQYLDERLVGVIEPVGACDPLVPSHRAIAQAVAAAWSTAGAGDVPPVVVLSGQDAATRRAIAAAACDAVGLELAVIATPALPTSAAELDTLICLWERETILAARALALEHDDGDVADAARERAGARIVEAMRGALIVSGGDRRRRRHRALVTFDVRPPRAAEQRGLWSAALGPREPALAGEVDGVASHFTLGMSAIRAAAAAALGGPPAALWDACRREARARLGDLAQRLEPGSAWDDLVLPDAPRQILREIAAAVRRRATVYEAWGFGATGDRGLGISALFAGPSGTGKTMAAEVLAAELRLDLYRIDLSQVVSKYIGETEKNLRRVFDAAEAGGAILLFDEADALFGKRSEVRDSHDRYANIEVSYLLQRMEAYRGLAILTTNMKGALDPAFLRRLRFVVHFPFPDAGQREEIWRRVFPSATPTTGLDPARLARLNVAGGNIRNIALGAAFLAAECGESVGPRHLRHAARTEYAKLERPLTEPELAGLA